MFSLQFVSAAKHQWLLKS